MDDDVLDKITIENKLLLFDAENELNIAIDRRDQVVDEILQIKDDKRRVREKREVALRDQDLFADKGDAERSKAAGLRAISYESRLEYLDAKLDWARAKLVRERENLVVARAKFELAKAKLVKKNNVPGASDIDIEDFEEQVKDYQEDLGEADEEIKVAEAEMKAKEEQWRLASRSVQDATGGALGSRWID